MLQVSDLLLIHGDKLVHVELPYDPAKAHEYYLLNRKLKGHAPSNANVPVGKSGSRAIVPVNGKVGSKVVAKSKPKLTSVQIKARTAALQTRLDTLRKVLAELVKQAKLRSGIKTPTDAAKKAVNPTATQKTAAAKASKEYYDKNKKKPVADDASAIEIKIKAVQEKIKAMRAELALAKKNTQKPRAGSVGVSIVSKNK